VEILWNSPVLAVEKENAMVNSIPTNMTSPCSVVARPPKGTLASFYSNSQVNASLALFSITAPIGSIIDISVSFALSNIYIAVPSITITTGTLGIIYYLALDHGVADTYVPLGRTTTA